MTVVCQLAVRYFTLDQRYSSSNVQRTLARSGQLSLNTGLRSLQHRLKIFFKPAYIPQLFATQIEQGALRLD